jgi:mRNA-degrading endonuclease RelE of RelBE toxin-antitoxin system
MTWTVAFTPAAARQIAALPDDIRARIRKAIEDRLKVEPKAHLLPLSGQGCAAMGSSGWDPTA